MRRLAMAGRGSAFQKQRTAQHQLMPPRYLLVLPDGDQDAPMLGRETSRRS